MYKAGPANNSRPGRKSLLEGATLIQQLIKTTIYSRTHTPVSYTHLTLPTRPLV